MNKITEEIKEIQKFGDSIKKLESEINLYSESLFKSIDFLSSEFQIGNNLLDFFENFNIATGEKKNISLKLRGDGIQAKFIPEMLNFVDSISKEKYFIWGFEEPENSAEYKNQQELAKKLKDKDTFTGDKQIFLTTHSEEFLSIYDSAEVIKEKRKANLYHVKKTSNKEYKDFSVIELFDVENNTFDFGSTKSALEEDLGSSLIRAKYSKESKEKDNIFFKEKKQWEKDKFQLEKQIQSKNVLFTEGKTDKIILEKAWDELYPKKNKNFDIIAMGGAGHLQNYIQNDFTQQSENRKGIALFDFDTEGFNQWNGIKFQDFEILTFKDEKCKKCNDENIFSILLNIPPHLNSYVFENNKQLSNTNLRLEIEHLFILNSSEDNFKKLFPTIKQERGIFELPKKKPNKDAYKTFIKDLKQDDFKNFKPLFDKVKELFKD